MLTDQVNFCLLYTSNTAVEEGRIAKDYFVFWGYEDKKLFEFAKADITKLAKSGKPFNMELVTIEMCIRDSNCT